MMKYENQEAVISQMRQLNELLYPHDPKKKQEHDEALKDVLRREAQKSYKVMNVNLGDRSE